MIPLYEISAKGKATETKRLVVAGSGVGMGSDANGHGLLFRAGEGNAIQKLELSDGCTTVNVLKTTQLYKSKCYSPVYIVSQ